jgi:hypothetical protein
MKARRAGRSKASMRHAPRVGRVSFLLAIGLACGDDASFADDGVETLASTSGAVESTSTTRTPPSSGSADSSTGVAAETTDAVADTGDDAPKLDVSTDTESVPVDCSNDDAPDLVYVMIDGVPNQIWSYDPVANHFEWFATVLCGEFHGEVTGFSIERGGDILVLSREPVDPEMLSNPAMQLTRVEPDGVGCEVEYYGALEGELLGWPTTVDCADLAFVSDPDDPDDERLFTHSCTGGGFGISPGIGTMHRADLHVTETMFEFLAVDDYSSAALAGTGDGRLYGVGGDQEQPGIGHILEYDRVTGALLSTTVVPGLDIGEYGSSIALAFYGGDLFTFGKVFDGEPRLVIRRYDLDDDDGDGEHQVTVIEPEDEPPSGIFAATSPTCIPLGPAG